MDCFPPSGIKSDRPECSVLLLWPRPKPALSPGTWKPLLGPGAPNNLSSSASTGKSRLRVLKIPHSHTKQIMDLSLMGQNQPFRVQASGKGSMSHTISLPPALGQQGGPSNPPALFLCCWPAVRVHGDSAVLRVAQPVCNGGHLPSVSFDVVQKEP